MKEINLLVLLFISGCSSSHIVNNNRYPGWVTRDYYNAAVGCSIIKNNNLLQSRKVAKAQAQADIAYDKSTMVTSEIKLSENDINISSVHTSHEVLDQYAVIKDQIIERNKRAEICVLYGKRYQ